MKTDGYWTVPRLWPNSTVFILGGGPSLADMDITPIQNHRVIGINDAYSFGDWVDLCYFGDWNWWKRHRERLQSFKGLIASSCDRTKTIDGVLTVQRRHKGLCYDPRHIGWNSNSGASAINLAYHLGADTVVLLGFDMKIRGTHMNWHDNPTMDNRVGHCNERLAMFKQFFATVAEDAKHAPRPFHIINATPGTELDVFPMIDLNDILEDLGE